MLDPATARDEICDVLVEDGQIAAIDREIDARDAEALDAAA